MSDTNTWTQSEAIELCRKIECACPHFGLHVALTGGLLYKEGRRKDCDLLFYRIRQLTADGIDWEALWVALASVGLIKTSGFGWCFKGEYQGKHVDMFNPDDGSKEHQSGAMEDKPTREELGMPEF